ncbi:MAG: peptidase S41 [Acidobacteria bacterium]|nr:MAG: peptidase S41 [Acidobacteriota bacterium]
MRRSFLRLSCLAAIVAVSGSWVAVSGQAAVAPQVSFAEPGISPDGREIAFVSGGDIWTVPATGGDARLLVAHEATESRPLFSPDGQTLAFVSTRTGGGDIYLMTIDTGALRRATSDDGLEQLDGWSRDGKWIYFSSTSRDIAGMNDIFRVSTDGGTPMAVTADRYTNEFGAAASPDGATIAFSARGNGSGQWWRKAGSHLDQAELWLAKTAGEPGYTELTPRDGRALWPMWSADGKSLFYMTDRNGAENLWTRPAAASGADRALTKFTDGRLLWPSITADGKTIAFERNFGIWTADTASGQAREITIVRRGSPTLPVPERIRQTSQFSDLALSPDGKKIAFIARGELFAASSADGGDAMRVTRTPAVESQPVWSPDSRKLAYVSTRDGAQHIYMYDFAASREEAVTSGAGTDLSPAFSPDGKSLVYLRALRDLRVRDLDTKTERSIATGAFGDALDTPRPMISPDGRWIALFAIGEKQFTNVSLVPLAADATPKVLQPVSFLANAYANTIAWGRDGSFLLFDTSQRTESGQLARVDLTLRTPKFREDTFRDLFSQPSRPGNPPATPPSAAPANPAPAAPAAPAAPVSPVFPDIRQRLSLLPTGLDVQSVTISPDGKVAVLIAAAAGQTNLYTWPLEELAAGAGVARQLTSTASGKSDVQFTPDSKEVFYLDNGRVSAVSLDRREVRSVSVTAEFMLDFESEKYEVFNQAWSLLRDNFFDPKFNGVDWDAERRAYLPRVAGAATADEMRRIVRLMIGDLNASHLGFTGGTPTVNNVGRLGLSFDRAEYESHGRLKVTGVTPLGPAAITRAVGVGDLILAVDGTPTGARVNLDDLLANTIDRRVTLTVASSTGGPTREVVIKPVNQATEKVLLYRQWVEANRAYVLKKSGGRLGYVHMIDMGQGSLDQLYVDLDAENHTRDGVIVDIRNNNGGFVNAYALDAFARQPYLRMSLRGLPTAPARVVLGQRALEKPTTLVINQHSLSDAEDFTEGYRTLKLGPIVGEPTAGWIIYTWNQRLFDGSTLRLPRMRITAVDGTDMERHSRPVDIAATRPIGETLTDKDSQLDAAIRALLARLGRAE